MIGAGFLRVSEYLSTSLVYAFLLGHADNRQYPCTDKFIAPEGLASVATWDCFWNAAVINSARQRCKARPKSSLA